MTEQDPIRSQFEREREALRVANRLQSAELDRLRAIERAVIALADAYEVQCDLVGGFCEFHGMDAYDGICATILDLRKLVGA